MAQRTLLAHWRHAGIKVVVVVGWSFSNIVGIVQQSQFIACLAINIGTPSGQCRTVRVHYRT